MDATAITSTELAREASSAGSDTLSVGRLLLLAAAEAFAFAVASPDAIEPGNVEFWRWVGWQLLFGVSLVGPLIVVPKARRGLSIGPMAYFWLLAGLGSWLFVPGMIWMRIADQQSGSFTPCLFYTQTMLGLWVVVALLATQPRALRLLKRPGPWSERCGLALALGWAPLGAWLLFDLYRDILP